MELIGRKAVVILFVGMGLLCGCAHDGSEDASSLLWPRSKYPTSVLLDFESPGDAVFVDAGAGAVQIDSSRAHNGHASLAIEGGTRQIVVKLGTLMRGRDFPGRWTLLGAYFLSPTPTVVTAQLFQGRQMLWRHDVRLASGQWTEAMVDITNVSSASGAETATLVFTFAQATPGVICCDDLQLVNN